MSQPPLVGVLLAAGRGRRMGRTKQLLPWTDAGGETTVVAAAFDAMATMCDRMVVVLGHETEAVATALGPRAFERATGDPDDEMLASVRLGVETAGGLDPDAAVALHPADHPVITERTRAALLAAARDDPDRAIIPTARGRGGHPIIVPAALRRRIVSYGGAGGLRGLWREHPELCLRITLDDPWIVSDLDTVEQYDRAKRLLSSSLRGHPGEA